MIPRTHPWLIRWVLGYVELEGIVAAAARFGLCRDTVGRWVAMDAAGDLVLFSADEYEAMHAARARDRRRNERYRIRRNRGLGRTTVDATGTIRRLQALWAMGWPSAHLGGRLGVTDDAVHHWMCKRKRVYLSTAQKVAALYGELGLIEGPSNRARIVARHRGWVTALAWDDDTIDDPAALPAHTVTRPWFDQPIDEVAVQRRMDGEKTMRLTPDERVHLVQRWTASGRSLNDCQDVTGIKPDRHFRFKDAS